ncbi:FIST signal transduction protein [Myxosarcina sp. GI1]|uniref:FIST signal transduction protein n=1 Tax=Myxosarcina sp. GI1 TaxID=1541065 RepID=UPI00056C32B9|nr:FIST N-terminal domain-containing protein [Myxosarcina sp. GI1]
MFEVVIGHSNDPDSQEAIAEVLEECSTELAGTTPQAGILYAAIDFEHDLVLESIYQQFPQLELIGCTTDGEISSKLGFQEDSLTLILFCSDEIEIRAGVGQNLASNPVAAVEEAITNARSQVDGEISLCLTLADGLSNCGVTIVEAIKQSLGKQIPLFGGMSADRLQFQKTYQFCQQQVYTNAIAVLLFSGKLIHSYGVANGWNPIGKRQKITKVDKNIVYELDNRPILDFYQYYLNDSFPSLEYPLAVFDEDSDNFYMRVPNNYDTETGSVSFFAEIPLGATVQIVETNGDRIIESSPSSMLQAIDKYPGTTPTVALFFSCATRRKILGTKAEREYEVINSCLPRSLPSCGFYTYGEISPLEHYPETFLHHETLIALLLGTR